MTHTTTATPFASTVAAWLALAATWFLFTGRVSWAEAAAALAAAAFAAWVLAARRHAPGRGRWGRPCSGWLATAAGLPWRLVRDAGLVLSVLARRMAGRGELAGSFRTIGFRRVGDAPASRTDRALTTIAASLLPNSYVVGVDREGRRAIVHELVPREGPVP